jgi:hypothetical protein
MPKFARIWSVTPHLHWCYKHAEIWRCASPLCGPNPPYELLCAGSRKCQEPDYNNLSDDDGE